MELVTLYSKSIGLETLIPPSEVTFDPDTGISGLAVGVDIEIDNSGRVRLTKSGFTTLFSGSYHSLWRDTGDAFVCVGTNLYKINEDKSLHLVVGGLFGSYVDYAQLGIDTFYSNGYQHGFIRNATNNSWVYSDRTASPSLHHMKVVPAFNHLAIADNRIYFSIGDTLFWTEMGLYGLYTPARNHVAFGSKIRMIRSVKGGLFVSTENWTWFLYGHDPHSFKQSYEPMGPPAHEWSVTSQHCDGMEIGLGRPGKCFFWTCDEGLCCGTSDGDIIITNKDSLIYPKANRGASLLYGDQLLHVLWKI